MEAENSNRLDRLCAAFWVIYVAFPLLTGLLAYHWLPNESFDEHRHVMLETREVTDADDNPIDAPGVWADKETGAVYSYEGFRGHRRSEAVRMAFVWFGYGLIACVFVSYRYRSRGLWKVFRIAILVDCATAAFTFITTWS